MSKSHTSAQKREMQECRKKIETYLLAEVRNRKHYFKTCDVAEALGLPLRTVGSNIGYLKNESSCLTIIRWSGCSAIVWKVTEKTEPAKTTSAAESD